MIRRKWFHSLGVALVSLLVLITTSTADAAPGSRLRFGRGGAPPAAGLPESQALSFGVKTRNVSGGQPLQYTGGKTLGITTIDGAPWAAGSPKWQITEENKLVPKLGTYLQACGTSPNVIGSATALGAGPYTIGLAEYTDATKTTPTGVTGTVTVSIRDMGANITTIPDQTPNICGEDTAAVNQLRTITGVATGANGALLLGDTIWASDGWLNPTGSNSFTSVVPSPTWAAGTGSRITVRPVNAATGFDSDGQPRRGGGFKIGKAYVSGTGDVPIDFREISFVQDSASTTLGTSLIVYSGTGSGINLYDCDLRYGPSTPLNILAGSYGAQVRGPTTISGCHFERTGRAVIGNTNGQITATNNVFNAVVDDAFQLDGGNHYIADNFFYNWQPYPGSCIPTCGDTQAHPDTLQIAGSATTGNIPFWGAYVRNISVRNIGSLDLDDAQGFFGAANGSSTIGGITTQNNIHVLTADGQWYVSRAIDPDVRFNTFLVDPDANTEIGGASIKITSGGTGGVFSYNVVGAFVGVGPQTGATVGPNKQFGLTAKPSVGAIAAYKAAVKVAFPYWPDLTTGNQNTRKKVLRQVTPAEVLMADGGVKNPDGTYNGALFPLCAGNDNGAWNNGEVFNPSNPAHCVAAN